MQKNKNRSGYKKTTVGWIPAGWTSCLGKDIAALVTKGSSPNWQGFEYQSDGVLFVTSENVRDGYLDISNPKFLPLAFSDKQKKSRLVDGDILINIVGASIGRVCRYQDAGFPANVNQAVCVFRCGTNVCTSFVLAYLQTSVGKSRLLLSQVESARPNVSLTDVRGLPIPLPSLPEQEAIAEVLECWDKAIRGYERKIEKKRNIKKGLMQRLLSGKQRLPAFDGDWKEVRLREIVDLIREKVGDRVVTPMSLSAGIGFVSQAEKFGRDISGEQYQHYTLLPKGCFTYNKGNSKRYPQGCVYLLEDYEEVAVPNVFISFRLHQPEADNEFFRQMFLANMHGRELVRYINSGVRNDGLLNLNTTNFLQIKLPLPPLPEQQAIATVLSSADAEIASQERKLAALRDQKRFLLNNMVTGTIRLPQFAADTTGSATGDTE